MLVSEYTAKRSEALNKMSFPDLELPTNLKILWIETVDKSYINNKILKQAHEHSFFEIHFVFSGDITYECNGDILNLGCGKAVLIPAYTSHKYISSSNDVLKTAIAFSVDNTYNLFEHKNTELKIIDFANNVTQNIDFILKQSEINDIFTPYLIAGRIMEILYSVFLSFNIEIPKTKNNSRDPRFLVAKAYIENNSDKIITCDTVAKECCVSTKQLGRIFRTEIGKSPSEYITVSKIRQSKKMLIDSNRSIKEIGFLLGFESESGFVSFFKRHCGIPPGVFRKQIYENALLKELE